MNDYYYKFNSKKNTIEFPILSTKVEECDEFIPYLKHKHGDFIEIINGKGDAFSYTSGSPVRIINISLKNKTNGSFIDMKLHDHWHEVIFEEVLNEDIPIIKKKFANKLQPGKMYKADNYFLGKVFHFIDDKGTKLSFFAFIAEWCYHQPFYFKIIDRLKLVAKSHYYEVGNYDHLEYLKNLDFRKLDVTIIKN